MRYTFAFVQDEPINQMYKMPVFFWGGGLSYVLSKAIPKVDVEDIDRELTVSNLSVTPSANYFVFDNLSIGLVLMDLLQQSMWE